MNARSSRNSLRKTAADQEVSRARPRAPTSIVDATTLASGGSARNSFGSLHGACGSAHVNSIAVGARMPWLKAAYAVSAGVGFRLMPSAGLSLEKRWLPDTSALLPLRSSMTARAWS